MKLAAHIIILLMSAAIAHWLRFGWTAWNSTYLIALLTGLLLASIVLPATGAFRDEFRWSFMRKIRRLIAGWAVVVMLMVAIAALLKVTEDYSRIWFGYWVLLGTVALAGAQSAAHLWQRHQLSSSKAQRNIVLVGGGEAAARVDRRLNAEGGREFNLLARFGIAWSEQGARPLEELSSYLDQADVQDVWIAAPLNDSSLLEAALRAVKNSLVNVHVVPDFEQYRLLNQSISQWGGLPVINLSGTPMAGSEMVLKSILDRAGALFMLLLLSPLLMAIAGLIRFSGEGPVLFRQKRNGFGGEIIEVLKFRTMKMHQEQPGQLTQAQAQDTRVTAVGRFLRRTSLDELPQLFNVLKGEMSLVGPRPHALEHNSEFMDRIPRYMLRHKVRPGITGWAQVNGLRGITDTEEKMAQRIAHDLWYIQNWSLWLDLQILFRTPFAMIGREVY